MKASEVLFRMKNENKKQEEELTNKIIEGNEALKNIQKMKNKITKCILERIEFTNMDYQI